MYTYQMTSPTAVCYLFLSYALWYVACMSVCVKDNYFINNIYDIYLNDPITTEKKMCISPLIL